MKVHYRDIDPRIKISYRKSYKLPVPALLYDQDNLYPQRMEKFVLNSGTAVRAQKTYASFLRGNGFENENDFVVNEKLGITLRKWLSFESNDMSKTQGISYIVNYNGMLQATEIIPVPFKWCRLEWDFENSVPTGRVYVYEDWEREKWPQGIQKAKLRVFDMYTNDVSKTRRQIREAGGINQWNGHIVWKSKDGEFTYPLAIFDSEVESMDTDSQIKLYHNNEIRNGFHANYMFFLNGVIEDAGKKEEVIHSLKSCTGAEGKRNLVFEAEENDTDSDFVSVKELSPVDVDKKYELTKKNSREAIRMSFGVPPELMGMEAQNGLSPNMDNLKNAETYYNIQTREDRELLNEWMQIGIDILGINAGNIVERETIVIQEQNGTTDTGEG